MTEINFDRAKWFKDVAATLAENFPTLTVEQFCKALQSMLNPFEEVPKS